MERLRDLASRPRRSGPFPFPFPVSLSRRNLFENTPKENNDDNDESLAQPSTADVHSGLTVSPSSQIGVSTQPVSNRTHHLGNEHSMGDNLETCRENKAKARQEARALQRETEQRLLAMADILTAHSDILTDSGLVLSRRLNELARDIFEANQIIARREREIAELTQQLGAMELRFNEVHVGLFKVSALVGEIIDGGIAQIHRNRTQATMEQALQGIRVVMGDEDVGEWEVGKVDGILAKLDSIYQKNKGLYQSKAVNQGVALLAQRFRDVNFNPAFNYLLAVDPDHSTTLQKYREDAHASAQQEKKSYPIAYFRHRDPRVGAAPTRSPPLESLPRLPDPHELAEAALTFFQPITTSSLPPRMLVTMRYREERLTLAQRELLWKMSSSPAIPTPAITWPRTPRQRVPREAGKLPAPPDGEPTVCDCLTCRVGIWAAAHPDQGPEVLKEAFVKSMGGMEVVHESLVMAMRTAGVGDLAPSFQEDMEELAREPYSKPSGFMSSSKDVENLGSARACE